MLEDKFRKLRNVWFAYHLKEYADERVFKDTDSESRDEDNKRMKKEFDRQTELIILGEKFL